MMPFMCELHGSFALLFIVTPTKGWIFVRSGALLFIAYISVAFVCESIRILHDSIYKLQSLNVMVCGDGNH